MAHLVCTHGAARRIVELRRGIWVPGNVEPEHLFQILAREHALHVRFVDHLLKDKSARA